MDDRGEASEVLSGASELASASTGHGAEDAGRAPGDAKKKKKKKSKRRKGDLGASKDEQLVNSVTAGSTGSQDGPYNAHGHFSEKR